LSNTPDYQRAVQDYLAYLPVYIRRRWWMHAFLRGLVALLWRGTVAGQENIPATGGVILMMNHASGVDPILCTGLVRHRYVITMAKIESRRNPLVSIFNWLWGNFPVKRGMVDRFALNITVELLKRDQLLLIAPEGTRNREGLRQPKDGIAFLATKADAIIVPAAVVNTKNWWQRLLTFRFVRADVRFGKPFRFKAPEGGVLTKAVREQMMREAMYQLALTIPDEYAEYRGIYQDVEKATTNTLEFLSPSDQPVIAPLKNSNV
jgi:1-acyl-sn-glycerol-3-phosphate acyltransferase